MTSYDRQYEVRQGKRGGGRTAWFCLVLTLASLAAGQEPQAQPQTPNAVSEQSAQVAADAAAPTGNPTDAPPDDDPPSMVPHFSDTRFWLSGQTNFIFQTHPPFPAAYTGKNSLKPNFKRPRPEC